MTKRELALEYLRCFCAGDIEELAPLLAPGLSFFGPLHSFNSAREYIASLERDPPAKSRYRLYSITEDHESVALFYDYEKEDLSLSIAQLFTIADGRICKIRLIFDTSRMTAD